MKAADDTACSSLAAWYRAHSASLSRRLSSRFVRAARAPGKTGKALGSEDVDDLIQDVFVRLLSTGAMPRLEGGHSPLPYLARVARNLAIDELRRRRREQQVLALSSASAPSDAPLGLAEATASAASGEREREGHEGRLERLCVYVALLPDELAVFYHARFVLGLSQRDTASELALSRRRVRTLDERLLAGAASWLEPRAPEAPTPHAPRERRSSPCPSPDHQHTAWAGRGAAPASVATLAPIRRWIAGGCSPDPSS
jgi:RNA polymerase sigma factor (sigma-70 family)